MFAPSYSDYARARAGLPPFCDSVDLDREPRRPEWRVRFARARLTDSLLRCGETKRQWRESMTHLMATGYPELPTALVRIEQVHSYFLRTAVRDATFWRRELAAALADRNDAPLAAWRAGIGMDGIDNPMAERGT